MKSDRRGFTLVELMIAAALLVLLALAVFQFLRSFTSLWRKSEERRELVEESSGIAEIFAEDLGALVNGTRGDLVADWIFFDTDGDDVAETMWPRLRFLRHASEPELVRIQAGVKDEKKKHEGEGILEVCWMVAPAYSGAKEPDRRAEGVVVRGERLVGSPGISYFDPAFFSGGTSPRTPLNEVSGGVLWFGVQFATETSLVFDGWKIGSELADTATSWDAWNKARPDAKRHYWNEPGKGMPKTTDRAVLPRRVRLELEVERQEDQKRRTRLRLPMTGADATLDVEDGDRLPAEPKSFVKIDAEWMQIISADGHTVSVRRGERGTPAVPHEAGRLVHFGRSLIREIPVRTHQENWNL